jgi:murein DD-endopeptidase MepM/ murein hydrolase activator NlpD
MKKKSTIYTVVFIPEDHGKTFSIRIKKSVFRYLIFSFVIIILGMSLLIYNTGKISVKLQLVHSLKSENLKLKDENRKLLVIEENLQKMESYREYLNRVVNTSAKAIRTPAPLFKIAEADDELATATADSAGEKSRTDTAAKGTLPSEAALVRDEHDGQKSSSPGIIPVQGWITRRFLSDKKELSNNHPGVDFAATAGSLIRASWSGVVDEISHDTYLGTIVTINHGNDLVSRYCHCSQVLVAKGDRVESGQAIALVGNTGRSSGPHLHFEVISGGKSVDPLKFIYINSLL